MTARLFAINAVMSVAGGIATTADIAWVFTPAGLGSSFAWNVLMAAVGGCCVALWRRRLREAPRPSLTAHRWPAAQAA